MTTDPFIHDDAAYVLGALSPQGRTAFERHLPTCPECTRRVSEFTPLVGLLAAVDADVFDNAEESVPQTLLPGLLRAARREQRRRARFVTVLGGLAAACLIALVLVLTVPGQHSSARARAMSPIVASPVHATAALTQVSWGTQIELACSYNGGYSAGSSYSLVVLDRQGHIHEAGSWTLTPEQVTRFTGGISLSRDQIAKVEITLGSTPILELTG
ncbi:MAG: zf-HC2 domain-containing protein [Actinomycetota bacterium]|nr:zf-HC2 domain-containing protein [Actinomycetota bacterium]